MNRRYFVEEIDTNHLHFDRDSAHAFCETDDPESNILAILRQDLESSIEHLYIEGGSYTIHIEDCGIFTIRLTNKPLIHFEILNDQKVEEPEELSISLNL